MKLSLAEAYDNIALFNRRAGKVCVGDINNVAFWKDVEDQIGLILEEVKETKEAAELGDAPELLKETVDVVVTLFNLLEKLERAGFDLGKALEMVCENNLLKVTTNYTKAKETLDALGEDHHYLETVIMQGELWYSVKRNSDNKIMKLRGHPRVDLIDCVPLD